MVDFEKQLPTEGLFMTPYGGNNDDNRIGGNCRVYTTKHRNAAGFAQQSSIMIDLGNMFGDRKKYEFDEFIPDVMRHLEKADGSTQHDVEEPLDGLLLTHGHEDHISAIPHYLRRGYKLPTIYAPKLTIETIRKQLENQGLWDQVKGDLKFKTVKPGDNFKVGNFNVTAVATSHSFADSLSYFVETPTANFLHTSDMKADPSIPVGDHTDFDLMRKLSKEKGCQALIIESTNAPKAGAITDEKTVRDEFLKMMKGSRSAAASGLKNKRIIVAVMGNNHQRLATMAELARLTNRSLYPMGPAITDALKVLKRAGHDLAKDYGLKFERSQQRLKSQRPGQQMIMATGTQGEVLATIARAARGEDSQLHFNPETDVLIMSSTDIPGNEAAIEKMLAPLRKKGVQVITPKQANTHSSGHGSQADIEQFIDALKPQTVLPMHGGDIMLEANAKFAESKGYSAYLQRRNDGTLHIGPKGEITRVAVRPDQWIGVYDANNDFRNPDYKYTRFVRINGHPANFVLSTDYGPNGKPKYQYKRRNVKFAHKPN